MHGDLSTRRLSELSAAESASIDELVDACPYSSPFHRTDWLRAVAEVFHIDIMLVTRHDAAGRVDLYLPLVVKQRWMFKDVCSYAMAYELVYGGPLWRSEPERLNAEFFDRIRRVLPVRAKNMSFTLPPDFPMAAVDKEHMIHVYNTSLIDLDRPLDELWASFDYKKVRWGINKAARQGINLSIGQPDAADRYHKYMAVTYERFEKTMLPLAYYQALLKLPFVNVFSAVLEKDPIAVTVVLTHHEKVYYWANASSTEHRKLCANDFLVWEIIKWAKQHGFKRFDFLITHIDTGVGRSDFKLKYGGAVIPVYEYVNVGFPAFADKLVYFLQRPERIVNRLLIKEQRGARIHV